MCCGSKTLSSYDLELVCFSRLILSQVSLQSQKGQCPCGFLFPFFCVCVYFTLPLNPFSFWVFVLVLGGCLFVCLLQLPTRLQTARVPPQGEARSSWPRAECVAGILLNPVTCVTSDKLAGWNLYLLMKKSTFLLTKDQLKLSITSLW